MVEKITLFVIDLLVLQLVILVYLTVGKFKLVGLALFFILIINPILYFKKRLQTRQLVYKSLGVFKV